jgi:hypothetical protein
LSGCLEAIGQAGHDHLEEHRGSIIGPQGRGAAK